MSSIRYTQVITLRKFLLKQMWLLQKETAEKKYDTEQTMKLYMVVSQLQLNSWPDSSVG